LPRHGGFGYFATRLSFDRQQIAMSPHETKVEGGAALDRNDNAQTILDCM
jgi:hypothetical protein